jgi:glycosyltransferase involved in cell wall biosynthesis
MNRKKTGGLITKGIFKESTEVNPLISLITIVYNGEKYLEQTIQSVIGQTYMNIEYIIIDAASTDGTLEIITKYENKIDYWISEPDSGISDAFNKGISLANGIFVGIVNSDDWLEFDAVETIVGKLEDNYSIYCGNLRIYDTSLNLIKTRKSWPFFLPVGMYVMHPTVFIKRDIYNEYRFCTTLKIAMDYDLLLRLRKRGYKIKRINKNISNMRIGGVSCNINKMREEERLVMRKNLPILLYIIARVKLRIEKFVLKILLDRKNQDEY